MTVTERSGTVYQFAQGPFEGGWSDPSTVGTWGMLAQTITDRNGNQITLNCPNSCLESNIGNLTNPALPAGYYTDTLWPWDESSRSDRAYKQSVAGFRLRWLPDSPIGAKKPGYVPSVPEFLPALCHLPGNRCVSSEP